MSDPTSSPSPSTAKTVALEFDPRGTLFAVPDGGHVRALHGTKITFTADFPFTLQFAQLTGDPAPLSDEPSCGSGPYSATVTLPALSSDAPAYKYTVKGGGRAAGRDLDPIIIVDKK